MLFEIVLRRRVRLRSVAVAYAVARGFSTSKTGTFCVCIASSKTAVAITVHNVRDEQYCSAINLLLASEYFKSSLMRIQVTLARNVTAREKHLELGSSVLLLSVLEVVSKPTRLSQIPALLAFAVRLQI